MPMTSPTGIRAGPRTRPAGKSPLVHLRARSRGPATAAASARRDGSVKSRARPSRAPRASGPQRRESPPRLRRFNAMMQTPRREALYEELTLTCDHIQRVAP
jgi:hypothetical protein